MLFINKRQLFVHKYTISVMSILFSRTINKKVYILIFDGYNISV
jgi:hypothetical protein